LHLISLEKELLGGDLAQSTWGFALWARNQTYQKLEEAKNYDELQILFKTAW
jgi:hypothetical protein